MGYRSDILLVAETEAIVAGVLADPNLAVALNSADSKCEKGTAIVYIFNDRKWYENEPLYPNVKAIQNFMINLERFEPCQYGFIRIGEDDDDIETQGDPGNWDCYINRELSY